MLISPISTSLASSDGQPLVIVDWPLTAPLPSQASPSQAHPSSALGDVVLIVHGLGEHARRYQPLVEFFHSQGLHVRAFDQYGHGQSGGVRGGLPTSMRLVDDLSQVIEETRRQMRPGSKLLLLGHSMGGVVAASWVRHHPRGLDGLILSSPALDPGLNPVQKLLIASLPRLMPNLRVDNGLKVEKVCRDTAVVKAYTADPWVHRKVSARLAQFIAHEGAQAIAAAPSWTMPTLLLYAGDDALVSPEGSRKFAQLAPPGVVTSHCFEAMYHEIFHDPQRDQVLAHVARWLAERRA